MTILRTIVTVLLVALLGACKAASGPEGSNAPRDAAERKQMITLLAQGINGPENPGDTAVAHWSGTIGIAVLGRSKAAQDTLFEQGIEPFMTDFNAITGVRFKRVAEAEANVLVIMAEDVDALRRDFERQMDRVLSDHRFTVVFEATVDRYEARCSYVALDSDYTYFGAVVFSSLPETDPHFAECVTPSLAGMVGLQGTPDGPGSIKSQGTFLRRPTELDRKALHILYGSKPGQKLRDIPALQDDI